MRRIQTFAVLTLLAAAALTAGCGSELPPTSPPATTGSTPKVTGSASPGPSGSASALIEFTVDGAGPYQLGATLASLQAAKSLSEVTTGGQVCPDNTKARGTGTWKDIQLSFRPDGKLYLAVNRSASIPTPSGAWLGTTLVQLKTIYAGVTGEDVVRSGSSAFLVTTLNGRGILFELDPGQRVISMSAGDSAPLKASYMSGKDYC